MAQPPAADPQRRGDRALPHRRADAGKTDQPGVLRLAAPRGRAASTRAASSSPSTPRARPSARCSTSSATPAAPSCSTATWPAGRGCSPGSGCYLDVKRMELAYHELNRREYELTKHVSLRQLDPLALIELRDDRAVHVRRCPRSCSTSTARATTSAGCESVAVSIPCVVGPYAERQLHADPAEAARSAPALRSATRLRPRRARTTLASATTSAACSPSSPAPASNDSGLFETNLRDERLPAVRGLRGDQPVAARTARPTCAQFDYDTISDVVLHLRYTAREGGAGAARGGRPTTLQDEDHGGRRPSARSGCCRCATSSPPSGPGSPQPRWTRATRSHR